MESRNVLVTAGVLFAVFLALSTIFESDDPGMRGVVADVSFFGWLLVTIFLIVVGIRALVKRYGSRERAE